MEKLDKTERNERTIPTMLLPKEAAEEFGIPIYRIREWCRANMIVCVPCGKKWLINRDRLIDFLNGEEPIPKKVRREDYER